jgi:organic hydroperoxide reductase OsmC/OhrA
LTHGRRPRQIAPVARHDYTSRIDWTGNRGQGTRSYRGYDRNWTVTTPGKPPIACSNDPLLGGDATLHNPEDLLLSSLAACHMLWYLHYASVAGIVVTAYRDDPIGVGENMPDGAGQFLRATLRPHIVLAAGSDRDAADAIHHEIHKVCFIARSVNFPVTYAARYSYG